MKRVPHSEVDYPGDGFYYHAGKRFTGLRYTLHDNEGWLEGETEFIGGLPSGITRRWSGPDRCPLVYEGDKVRAMLQHDDQPFDRGIWILNNQKTKILNVFG